MFIATVASIKTVKGINKYDEKYKFQRKTYSKYL